MKVNYKRLRYKQYEYHLNDIDNLNLNWSLEKYGCGPTSIANILVNFGFRFTPIDIARKILFNKEGNFDNTYLRNKGINEKGLIYCLDRLIKEEQINIIYEIIKINFSNPYDQKQKIENMFQMGYMAIIHVGPSEISPQTFSKSGHYLVISDMDEDNNFYVINSNRIGDNQIGQPFSYEIIIKNMIGRKDSFNFLFIKRT